MKTLWIGIMLATLFSVNIAKAQSPDASTSGELRARLETARAEKNQSLDIIRLEKNLTKQIQPPKVQLATTPVQSTDLANLSLPGKVDTGVLMQNIPKPQNQVPLAITAPTRLPPAQP